MNELYDDMWIKRLSVIERIHKCFKMTDDIMTSDNDISYTNLRGPAVSVEIRKGLGKKDKH